jgi:hypothetical protein
VLGTSQLKHNGPAIWGGSRYAGQVVLPDAIPADHLSRFLAEDFFRPEKEGMAHFLPSRYKYCEVYACRDTSLSGAAHLSSVAKLVAGTGAVSRYKVDQSQ